ncbi:uncharacterized protein LOC119340936 [Triticum dicoccoides]|uniref:uncharacterized protein LOC119340936 n=1 Tax=Triticum dicoccoides TaxID=85692 RepID=UPI0018913DD0|nr:uncharacterized protein LOC119340936 [Triticum dicoccoides]
MQGAPAGSLAAAAITWTCLHRVSSDPDMSRRHLLRVCRPLSLVLPCNPCLAMHEDNDDNCRHRPSQAILLASLAWAHRPSPLARVGRIARGQVGPCQSKCRCGEATRARDYLFLCSLTCGVNSFVRRGDVEEEAGVAEDSGAAWLGPRGGARRCATGAGGGRR